jgi:hypothetical protein
MYRVALLLILLMASVPETRIASPLDVSFWYWNTPFRLSQKETSQLKDIGVKRLFVRGGTFTHGYGLMEPQQWSGSGSPFKIDLVFNFDSGLLKHFSALEPKDASTRMATAVNVSLRKAMKAGVRVEGVQFDIDCPTRLLPKYAELLGDIRPKIGLNAPWKLSVTGLSSWMGTDGLRQVADKVDFLAPQFYESDIALESDDVRPIGDLHAIRRGLPLANELGKPVYAGLATYGRALLYDPAGHLAGVYHGLQPEDALRHPYLRFQSVAPVRESGSATNLGEDHLALLATGPSAEARGYKLIYDLPTSALLAQELEAVYRAAPANCHGVILYRLPQDQDGMALSLDTVTSVLRGKHPSARISLEVNARQDPWSLVDTKGVTRASQVRVLAQNRGDAATGIGPGGLQVLVAWPHMGIDEIAKGDFDATTAGRYNPETGSFQARPPAEANAVLLTRSRLLSGEKCESGVIEMEGKGRPVAFAKALTEGEIGSVTASASLQENHR